MAPMYRALLTVTQLALTTLQSWYPDDTHRSLSVSAFNITLKPTLPLDTNQAAWIDAVVMLESPGLVASATLLTMELLIANVPTNRYDGDALIASDAQGHLPLVIHDQAENGPRDWVVARATQGDVSVSFRAFPREVNLTTPVGPRIDLRVDQGGFHGTGMSFIPVPPGEAKLYNLNVVWDLSHAPCDTKTVWTYGEGSFVNRKGPVSSITNALYTVGPLNSITSPDSPNFGLYWFGTPPFNTTDLGSTLQSLFSQMAPFFHDSVDSIYRIVIRKSLRGFGGSAFERSFILEYDEAIMRTLDNEDLFHLVAHEMVHNWPLLESAQENAGAWYSEGIANYYSNILPFRFGIYTPDQFLKWINEDASSYYTSPAISFNNSLAAELEWTDPHAQRIPYYRGCMYAVQLDYEIRQASGGKRSLDNLVLALLELKHRRQRFGLDEWLDLLRDELGERAVQGYYEMADASLVVPDKHSLDGFELVRLDQERYELGFHSDSLTSRVIKGLDPQSRAGLAGIQEGDAILSNGFIWFTADKIESMMEMKIKRGDAVFDVKYWPRSFERVETYQWVKV